MFIIWRGKGIYVLLIFGAILFAYYMLFAEKGNEKIFQGYAPESAFIGTGILCFLLATRWKSKEGSVYFDPAKNKDITIRPGHSFFYINVYYWAFILTALGFVCLYNH